MILLLWLACAGTPASAPIDPGPASAALPAPGGACRKASDCVLSNLRSASDCCGDPCDSGYAYAIADLAAAEAHRDATCAIKDYACPQADCDLPQPFVTACVQGRCAAVVRPAPVAPIATACASDVECTLSCYGAGDCCGSCDCEQPWHVADLAKEEARRTAECDLAACPMKKCVAPQKSAKCVDGACVAR